MTKEVEKEAEELERIEEYLNSIATSDKGIQRVIQTVIKKHTDMVLAELIDYAADTPMKKAAIKMALKVWLRS